MTKPPSHDVLTADAFLIRGKATWTFYAVRATIGLLIRFVFRIDVEGKGNIPSQGPYVLIANHLGWLDPFALILAFPSTPRLHFLGNPQGVVKSGFNWWLITHIGGFIPVYKERHNVQGINEAADLCLERHGVVALFPEGDYSPVEGELLEFHSGFAHFAHDKHVPILPVALNSTKDLWLFKTVNVTIGEAFEAASTIDETVETGRKQVEALLRPRKSRGPRLFRKWLTNFL